MTLFMTQKTLKSRVYASFFHFYCIKELNLKKKTLYLHCQMTILLTL